MKMYSILLAIKEIKFKTTTGYQLTSIGMTVIKKTANDKYRQGGGEKHPPPALLVGI